MACLFFKATPVKLKSYWPPSFSSFDAYWPLTVRKGVSIALAASFSVLILAVLSRKYKSYQIFIFELTETKYIENLPFYLYPLFFYLVVS